jgi:arylsulfatase A-like enzyme
VPRELTVVIAGERDRRAGRGAPLAALLALSLLACRGPHEEAAAPAARRPVASGTGWSVLLITIDTLRADHVGAYGYARPTTPHIDALAAEGTLFESAYTYWPKTRGSFVAMLTGRRASQSGYSKTHPLLLGMNPTLASVLHDAGYDTVAAVDNANVAASLGYAKGFRVYQETWEDTSLTTEMDRARAITEAGVRLVQGAEPSRPFLLWLHYVNPHAPYTPPSPYDSRFLPPESEQGPRLPVVSSLHGGIPRQWAVPGEDRLGYYVAQYDGEMAAVDAEAGRVCEALRSSAVADSTVVVLTSDHGESLGEHDYYFDHGEDLFDPSQRVPLIVRVPGAPRGRRSEVLASTLDVLPTILDAIKVSYPAGLAGHSLLGAVEGGPAPERSRLFGQNDRGLTATWDERFKLVASPEGDGARLALYDRREDPGETRDVSARRKRELRTHREALERYLERADEEWERLREMLAGTSGEGHLSSEACERLRAIGYVVDECQ